MLCTAQKSMYDRVKEKYELYIFDEEANDDIVYI